ncbi:hypothetical protein BLA24_05105 [Streptomyces cinnamoneus]|uniref:Amine oxidase domain-containing protein n=1 Tax=Streptomyces cinnamoneus TaxID=53446 RepID=A0A2G1XP08_STRCJ|nr:NAD(P)/FAD-dependent oxidoreductase [Streptomyces cinnamoneus]PHQ52931.1 hypothetical protein BLA24_05105 [Streptomyces cinnamoneus]PPT11408.1 FAD-dependent oxidoreductase [Streptomyces cinnamoneus]
MSLPGPGSRRTAPEAPGAVTDTLVVGAGMAGLYAARELHRAGRDVVVLEVRDRVGGRVWSDRWEGGTIDLGASWIHGVEGNPVADLAREAGAGTLVNNAGTLDYGVRAGAVHYGADGRRLTPAECRERQRDHEAVSAGLFALARTADPDESLASGLRRALADSGLTPARALRVLHARCRMAEDDWGAGAEELCLSGLVTGQDHEGDEVVFPDGYGQLTRHLATGLDVRLGHRVTRVEHGDGGVTVHIDGQGVLTARRALITLPLGVLKEGSVTFDPALPEPKLRAVERLGMGLYDKLFLRFPRPFWDESEVIGQEGTPHGAFANWYDLRHVVGAPVLLALNGGPVARRLQDLDDTAVVRAALNCLRGLYGERVEEPSAHRVTRWGTDPYARGAYSYPAVGSLPGDHDALAAPVGGRLHFAGEATSADHSSTVHGAVLSGLREARRILGTDGGTGGSADTAR